MNSVLDLLPHDMGLRVELDTNETYYLESGMNALPEYTFLSPDLKPADTRRI